MLRIVSVIFFSFIFLISKAQNNLIVIQSNGTPFYLYINDKKINDSAQSIVKVHKVWGDTCRIKVKNHNQTDFSVNTTAYLMNQKVSCHDMEFTYAIENIKGKNQLRFISVNAMYADTLNKHKNIPKLVEKYRTDMQQQIEYKDRVAENYPPPSKCTTIISDSLLDAQVYLLKENHIGLNRMKDAKWFITHNCINVAQFEKILETFDAERSKENLAEFGYDYLYDKNNFLNLTKALRFRTEQELLKTFYNKKAK